MGRRRGRRGRRDGRPTGRGRRITWSAESYRVGTPIWQPSSARAHMNEALALLWDLGEEEWEEEEERMEHHEHWIKVMISTNPN